MNAVVEPKRAARLEKPLQASTEFEAEIESCRMIYGNIAPGNDEATGACNYWLQWVVRPEIYLYSEGIEAAGVGPLPGIKRDHDVSGAYNKVRVVNDRHTQRSNGEFNPAGGHIPESQQGRIAFQNNGSRLHQEIHGHDIAGMKSMGILSPKHEQPALLGNPEKDVARVGRKFAENAPGVSRRKKRLGFFHLGRAVRRLRVTRGREERQEP